MQQYHLCVKRNLQQMLLLAAAEVAVCAWYGKTVAAFSLFLGNIASIIYFLQLVYRIKRSSALPPGKATAAMQAGWVASLVFIALFFVLATKLAQVNLLLVVIGLFSFQFILVIDSIVIVLKGITNSKRKE
ncbi:MAG: synthase chain [Firmicutes bacterium]|nr:synthase chain [Bacillota bacterium]